MKFLKIYIKNFKGIRSTSVIELSEHTTLLTGANGFGKTTIFDAIELCLTGQLHRTEIKKGVTKDTQGYKKPFFQNSQSDEVTLKLWLKNESDEELIIVRHLNREVSSRPKVQGKPNKATEFSILELYTEDSDNFHSSEFNVQNATAITQADINDFFEFANTEIDINGIYHIFNYLQQEETTFFLKKSEQERKNSLGFLLRTDTQEEKLKVIKKQMTKLKELRSYFESERSEVSLQDTLKVDYKVLYPSQNIELDKLDPFDRLDKSAVNLKFESLSLELDKLTEFHESFVPDEFFLKEECESVKSLILDVPEFKEHFILRNYLQPDVYKKFSSIYADINNEELIEAYILQDISNELDELVRTTNKFIYIDRFETAKEIELHDALLPLINSFSPDLVEPYSQLLQSRSRLETTLVGVSKSVVEIKGAIKDLDKYYREIFEHEEQCKCPYCGTKFSDIKSLSNSLKDRLTSFEEINNSSSNAIYDIDKKIEIKFILPIKEKITEFKSKNKRFELALIEKLKKFVNSSRVFNFSNIDRAVAPNEKLKWDKMYDLEFFDKTVRQVKDSLLATFPIDEKIWGKLLQLSLKDFKRAYALLDNLALPKELSIDIDSKYLSSDLLKEKIERFSSYFVEYIATKKYDPAKCSDPEQLFKKYYKKNKDIFLTVNGDSLEQKKLYLAYKVNAKESEHFKAFDYKISAINKTLSKLNALKEIYQKEISAYKKEMIRRIQIPFFIYTAKILQNYQQGMGIFIYVKDDSAIRFLANDDSDHDIMHHLSSGQLAVVALAFSLAINKTFEISPNLRFLAIDDPVQEMDVLNIHSFVDLVRTELSEDYQLIFSTHDSDNALFMKYKLEKLNQESVKLFDVQQNFFPPLD